MNPIMLNANATVQQNKPLWSSQNTGKANGSNSFASIFQSVEGMDMQGMEASGAIPLSQLQSLTLENPLLAQDLLDLFSQMEELLSALILSMEDVPAEQPTLQQDELIAAMQLSNVQTPLLMMQQTENMDVKGMLALTMQQSGNALPSVESLQQVLSKLQQLQSNLQNQQNLSSLQLTPALLTDAKALFAQFEQVLQQNGVLEQLPADMKKQVELLKTSAPSLFANLASLMEDGDVKMLEGKENPLLQFNAKPMLEGSKVASLLNTTTAPAIPIYSQQGLDQLSQFVKQLQISQQNGISEATIKLVPEQLGQVQVKISMQNGQMVAQFMAETLVGKEAIESQLAQLRTNLQNQGIQVDKLEVIQQEEAPSFQQQPGQQQQFSNEQQQFTRNNSSSAQAVYDENMDVYHPDLEVEMDVDQPKDIESHSFHATV
ncbi:flagellar hook-length control protein FliK [Longirhabdus pacifica]|uniref:flagellar hook-length control protein FliK n=1 Tax=Longirhabdus pacifica TaxID=2305227 RepID=UPI00100910BD|nr:flagellar hook-length control protein FliK [Longirhabdus pacifica]